MYEKAACWRWSLATLSIYNYGTHRFTHGHRSPTLSALTQDSSVGQTRSRLFYFSLSLAFLFPLHQSRYFDTFLPQRSLV
jgi:hypothetical protein